MGSESLQHYPRVRQIYAFLACLCALIGFTAIVNDRYGIFPQNFVFYFILAGIWLTVVCGLMFSVFSSDLRVNAAVSLNEFASLTASLARQVRHSIDRLQEGGGLDQKRRTTEEAIRRVLNLAHEAFSLLTRERCTASLMLIQNGAGKTRIYDDFAPIERMTASMPIPIDKGVIGMIISRNLATFTVDDYAKVGAFPTPTLVSGMCRSGVCAPVRIGKNLVGFFNIDCTVSGMFKTTDCEKASLTVSESIGSILAVAQSTGVSPIMVFVDEQAGRRENVSDQLD